MKRFHSNHPIHRFQKPDSDAPVETGLAPPIGLIWEVSRPPSELYVQGKSESLQLLDRLPARGLAIVGSRECQPRSLREISAALSELRGFDLVIVSGLARGIDAHAHRRALEEGFPTVAILGCGIDWSYPEENDELRTQILESGGLVVSEFAPEARAKPDHFIRRNRLIAGWSSATWIVEAGARSGAINTATWTKLQDRPCFVTPCYPGDPTLEGNQRLLESRQVTEGRIRPFWSSRSLGEVWLELESFFASAQQPHLPFPPKRAGSQKQRTETDRDTELQREVLKHTLSSGGISIPELLEWSNDRGESVENFYEKLRTAIESGSLLLRGASLVAPTL